MTALLVVNPAAGGGRTERLWRDLRDDLHRRGFAFEWTTTTGPGRATDLAREAAEAGVSLVVAVGGDGTLNEVVNGAVGDERPRPVVGAILTGRGRDAARNFGIAADPRQAARRLVEGIETTVDLVRAEWPGGAHRWVVSAAGAGFDAAVAARAATRRGPGTLSYLLSVVTTLSQHATVPAEIEADGERAWTGPLTAAVVANGAHYGGGMKIAPAANPADGRLDLVVLGDLGRLELLCWLPTVYRGRHLANPKIRTRAARRVTVRSDRPLPVHVDGEPAPPTPVTLTIRPGALRLRV
ncbi:MAG TPA: diacylglycerol kinase family protein [Methylomirabilota bacterium]